MAAFPEGSSGDDLTAHTIAALLKSYYYFWGDAELQGVQMRTEEKFKSPLKGAKQFTVEGKIDRLGTKADGRAVQVEYKTTSDSLAPDSGYWLRLRFNVQLLQYFLAARALGFDIQEVIYDVVRKPSIQPKMIDDLDEQGRKIVTDQTGKRIFNEKGKNAGEPRQSADKERGWTVKSHLETPEEFGIRLYQDAMARPDFYFARREIPILESDLEEFQVQRLVTAKTILHHRKLAAKLTRPEFAWPRHVSEPNCAGCQYSSFCLQNLSVDINNPPQGFAVKPFNPELHESTTETEIAS